MAKFALSFPVKPHFVNQEFGVDKKTYSQFGVDGHNGLDLRTYHGQEVFASHDGTAYYEIDNNQGHGVVIVSNDAYLYEGTLTHFKTIYWHLCDPKKEPGLASKVWARVGKRGNSGRGVSVKQGDIIGYADNTGFSSGDHLHYGLKPVIPGKGVKAGDAPDVGIGNWVNLRQDNGFKGAIDPTPYLPAPKLPTGTTVNFATAVRNLVSGGLAGKVFYDALAILKKKYNA